MNRRECLEAATRCVCFDRNSSYGEPEDNFEEIALLLAAAGFERYGRHLSRADVATLMILTKIAREAHNHSDDNWVDIAGYAACGAEVVAADLADADAQTCA